MILGKQREQRYIRKHIRLPLSTLYERMDQLRQHGSLLVITPAPTGYNWMGVNRASHGLFPGAVLELPQYYSQPVYSPEELKQFCDAVHHRKFDQVVFSGFPDYYGTMAIALSAHGIVTGCIYHGFLSELANNPVQSASLLQLLKLVKDGSIRKIGFNKQGFAETIQQLWGIETYKIILKTSLPETIAKKNDHASLNIGVLGNDQFRKNIHNQVAAALLIKNAQVHVTGNPGLEYLNPGGRITRHEGNQSHQDYIQLLGTMDINLHISFSESWGQVTMESLAMGIPCLVARHSDILDYDQELKSLLVVDEYDNSLAISHAIGKITGYPSSLSEKCRVYVQHVNSLATEKIKLYLDA